LIKLVTRGTDMTISIPTISSINFKLIMNTNSQQNIVHILVVSTVYLHNNYMITQRDI